MKPRTTVPIFAAERRAAVRRRAAARPSVYARRRRHSHCGPRRTAPRSAGGLVRARERRRQPGVPTARRISRYPATEDRRVPRPCRVLASDEGTPRRGARGGRRARCAQIEQELAGATWRLRRRRSRRRRRSLALLPRGRAPGPIDRAGRRDAAGAGRDDHSCRNSYAFALNRSGRFRPGRAHPPRPHRARADRRAKRAALLGRVYKDRWERALEDGKTLERPAGARSTKAIAAYLKGFETRLARRLSRRQRRDVDGAARAARSAPHALILPVVAYAVERRIARRQAGLLGLRDAGSSWRYSARDEDGAADCARRRARRRPRALGARVHRQQPAPHRRRAPQAR